MKKQQVFHIHGGESFQRHEDFVVRLQTVDLWHLLSDREDTPFKKWTSRLADDLGENYEVIMPPMPNKQNAKFAEWSIWFERHFNHLQDGAILMGYSLGAMFLAKYLSQNNLPFRPKAVFLLAGAYRLPSFDDTDCSDFLVAPESVCSAISKTDRLIIMHSQDDHVVPYEHGVTLSNIMPDAEFVSYTDKNHFLIPEFPQLLKIIREIA